MRSRARVRPQLSLWLVVISVQNSGIMMGFCDFSYLGLAEAETVLYEVTILPYAFELNQYQLPSSKIRTAFFPQSVCAPI